MTLDEIARALVRHFPELEIRPVRLLDTGFDSLVVETADGNIFRIARTAAAAQSQALEWKLLPQLRLPVAVPRPEWRIEPNDPVFEFGVIGHRKLRGRPATSSDPIGAELGEFLSALHAVQPPEGVRGALSWRDRLRGVEWALPALAGRAAGLETWWRDALENVAMAAHPHVLIHGDLWYENVLVDGDPPHISGVLDWGGVRIGDPAVDLAPQFYLGTGFVETVLDAYGADAGLRHRTQRYRVLREFEGICWSLQRNDFVELEESVEKLRRALR